MMPFFSDRGQYPVELKGPGCDCARASGRNYDRLVITELSHAVS